MAITNKDLGIATAYGEYLAKGGTKTEEEFAQMFVDFESVATEAAQSATAAAQSATAASGSATAAASSASLAAQSATEARADAQTAANAAAGVRADANRASEAAAESEEIRDLVNSKVSTATQAASTASAAAGNAANSAGEASTAAQTATQKASEIVASAEAASQAKTDAVSAKTAAQTAAQQAGSSETAASSSAQAAAGSASTAQTAAQTATQKAGDAEGSASSASGSASTASTKATEATTAATLAQSYAKGDTSSRSGEATDNAKYYKEQAEAAKTAAEQAAASITVDATLSQSGKAADAKKTGDEISEIKNDSSKNLIDVYQIKANTASALVTGHNKVKIQSLTSGTYKNALVTIRLKPNTKYVIQAKKHTNSGIGVIALYESTNDGQTYPTTITKVLMAGTAADDTRILNIFTTVSGYVMIRFFATYGTAESGNVDYYDIILEEGLYLDKPIPATYAYDAEARQDVSGILQLMNSVADLSPKDFKIGGIYNSNGQPYNGANFATEDYYPVNGNIKLVTKTLASDVTGGSFNFHFYDSTYTFLSAQTAVSRIDGLITITPPTNAVYFKVQINSSNCDDRAKEGFVIITGSNPLGNYLLTTLDELAPTVDAIRPYKQYNTAAAFTEDFPDNKIANIPVNKIICLGIDNIVCSDKPEPYFTGNVVTICARNYLSPGAMQFGFSLKDEKPIYRRRYIYNASGNYWGEWSVFGERIHRVGPTRADKSLVSFLINYKDDTTPKTIYIDEGTYDIFAEYMAEVNAGRLTIPADDITAGDYFYPYNAFVPNNTKIVGLGNVVLQFTPEADEISYGASRTWSPLNVYGNVEIENITVIAHNCRYCLHNDDHNAYPNSVQTYKNCRFIFNESDKDSQNRTLGFNHAIGFGINENSVQEYDNCEMLTNCEGNNSAIYGHERNDAKNGKIVLRHCIVHSSNFSNTRVIRLQSLATSQGKVEVLIENCYVNGSMELNMYYATSPQNFDVTFTSSNKMPVRRTIASGGTIVDPYPVKWYNPLPTPTAAAPLIETDAYSA